MREMRAIWLATGNVNRASISYKLFLTNFIVQISFLWFLGEQDVWEKHYYYLFASFAMQHLWTKKNVLPAHDLKSRVVIQQFSALAGTNRAFCIAKYIPPFLPPSREFNRLL